MFPSKKISIVFPSGNFRLFDGFKSQFIPSYPHPSQILDCCLFAHHKYIYIYIYIYNYIYIYIYIYVIHILYRCIPTFGDRKLSIQKSEEQMGQFVRFIQVTINGWISSPSDQLVPSLTFVSAWSPRVKHGKSINHVGWNRNLKPRFWENPDLINQPCGPFFWLRSGDLIFHLRRENRKDTQPATSTNQAPVRKGIFNLRNPKLKGFPQPSYRPSAGHPIFCSSTPVPSSSG